MAHVAHDGKAGYGCRSVVWGSGLLAVVLQSWHPALTPRSVDSGYVVCLLSISLPKICLLKEYALQIACGGIAGDCGLLGESQRSAGMAITGSVCQRVPMVMSAN